MSNHEFENYLKLIGKLLQLTRGQQEAISVELRDHLESRVAELVDEGVGQQQAVSRAIEEFGDAAVMAKNFQFVSQCKRRRWMMRFATLSTAGLFMVAVLTMAMWPPQARFGAPDTAMSQAVEQRSGGPQEIADGPSAASQLDAQVEQKLLEPATLIYDEVPWNEIRSELEKQYRFNIVLDQSAIDDSLTEDEPISANLENVPLEHALKIMLKDKNATFVIDHGVMIIISLDEADNPQFFQLKMYDCRVLLAKLVLAQSKSPPATSSIPAGGGLGVGLFNDQVEGVGLPIEKGPNGHDASGGMGGQGLGGQGLGGQGLGGMGGGGAGSADNIETKEGLLLDLLKSMVRPDSWVENGGAADARIINGILIVNQSRERISEVDRLLQDLNFYLNAQPGNAKFPVGVKAPVKEPKPQAELQPEDANGNLFQKLSVGSASGG